MTRILMVEDHRFFAEAFALMLDRGLSKKRGGPIEVRRAETRAEGLRLLSEGGAFDLAIVDLMLPDGDGTDVVRAAKERWPAMPVVVFSSVEDLSGALDASADEGVRKDVDLPQVIALVDELLANVDRTAT